MIDRTTGSESAVATEPRIQRKRVAVVLGALGMIPDMPQSVFLPAAAMAGGLWWTLTRLKREKQAAEALAGDLSHGFEPPPPLAIAHQLMKAWVEEG